MDRHLTVLSSLSISEGCSMRHQVHDGAVDFFIEDGTTTVEMTIDLPALRELVRLGHLALAQSALQSGE